MRKQHHHRHDDRDRREHPNGEELEGKVVTAGAEAYIE